MAPPDQRTPAGRLLPVTLAAVSAADIGRPDTRPRFWKQQRTADAARCPVLQPPGHRPAGCRVRGGRGCRRTAAETQSRSQHDGHRPPCAPARLPGQPGPGRRSRRTPTVRTRGQRTHLGTTGRRPVSGAADTDGCGRVLRTLRQGHAGQPPAKPSTAAPSSDQERDRNVRRRPAPPWPDRQIRSWGGRKPSRFWKGSAGWEGSTVRVGADITR